MTDNKAAEAMERVSNWLERGRHGAPAPGRSDLRTLLTLAQSVDQGMMEEAGCVIEEINSDLCNLQCHGPKGPHTPGCRRASDFLARLPKQEPKP
jgi:hypothetical protein